MSYLVDTNVWISYLRRRGSTQLSFKIQSIDSSQILICTVVRAELMTGVYKCQNPSQELKSVEGLLALFPSLAFDEKSADIYGSMRAELEKTGKSIGSNDLMIAAIAIANRMILVTHNIAEFSRVPGLQLEDWQ